MMHGLKKFFSVFQILIAEIGDEDEQRCVLTKI